MKTIISTIFLCVLLSFIPELRAQNIQLHYDFGRSLYDKDLKERPLLTSTVEKFHPDTWGSTYFFVDMDYTSEGVASAYWEIAREVKFWKGPFSAHLEYNGGLAKGFSYKNAYLAGATYTYNNASFSKGFSLTAMYKYIQKHKSPNNFQLTGHGMSTSAIICLLSPDLPTGGVRKPITEKRSSLPNRNFG